MSHAVGPPDSGAQTRMNKSIFLPAAVEEMGLSPVGAYKPIKKRESEKA